MSIDKALTDNLVLAAQRAAGHIREALNSGAWAPRDCRNPESFLERLSETLADTPAAMDLALCQDLSDIAMAAIEAGDWSGVGEEDISALQRFAFLTHLASDMAPAARTVELAV